MQKKIARLVPVLIISFSVLLTDSACAVWPFSSGKQKLSSQEVVAKKSGPVTSASSRLGRSIMRTVNPCHGPSCLSVVDLAHCAEKTGLALAEFLNNPTKLFFTDSKGDYHYVKVQQKNPNYPAWSAAYEMYQQALRQYKSILVKQNDVQNLLNDINLQNEREREQVEEEQTKLAMMQKQYLLFLAKNELFNIEKFKRAQNRLEETMAQLGEDAGLTLPQPVEPQESDDKYVEVKQATVRVMDRAVQKAVNEFAERQFFCLENFCYHNCVQKALYSEKDVKDFLHPEADTTIVDVTRAQANFVFKVAQRCLGGDPKASVTRVLCSKCTEGFLGKNVRPIDACTNVHNNEFKKQPEQSSGFGGMGMFG